MPEPITEYDIDSIRDLQPEDWPDIIPMIKFYIANSFCKPIKVSIDNKIAGIGTGILLDNTAWLAHIIVSPEFRNNGIGSSIVKYLIEYYKSISCETVSLIATSLGYPVYKRAGFIEETEYLLFERDKPLDGPLLSDNIIKFTENYTNGILALDRKISGENRDKILLNKICNSYIYKDKNNLAGYYIPDLGEGLIVAESDIAGIELMKLKYSIATKGFLPADNVSGIRFLQENGFNETKRIKRMFLGKKLLWQPEKIFSRIAGNLG